MDSKCKISLFFYYPIRQFIANAIMIPFVISLFVLVIPSSLYTDARPGWDILTKHELVINKEEVLLLYWEVLLIFLFIHFITSYYHYYKLRKLGYKIDLETISTTQTRNFICSMPDDLVFNACGAFISSLKNIVIRETDQEKGLILSYWNDTSMTHILNRNIINIRLTKVNEERTHINMQTGRLVGSFFGSLDYGQNIIAADRFVEYITEREKEFSVSV